MAFCQQNEWRDIVNDFLVSMVRTKIEKRTGKSEHTISLVGNNGVDLWFNYGDTVSTYELLYILGDLNADKPDRKVKVNGKTYANAESAFESLTR